MQLSKIADDVCKLGGRVFLDPQFYLPYSDHERLRSHDYWPNLYESGGFWAGVGDLTRLEFKSYVQLLHLVSAEQAALTSVLLQPPS
jgi:hypothetical protein